MKFSKIDQTIRTWLLGLMIGGLAYLGFSKCIGNQAPIYDGQGTLRKPLVVINGQNQQIPSADTLSSPGGLSTNGVAASSSDVQTNTITATVASGSVAGNFNGRVNILNSGISTTNIVETETNGTASRSAVQGRASGTYDTTGGATTAGGGSFVANATRAIGGNTHTNISVGSNASGGQVNYAWNSLQGLMLQSGDAEFGGNLYAVGPAPPAITSCGGGSPGITGDNNDGTVVIGTAATGCVITFTGGGYSSGSGVSCTPSSQGGVVFTYTTSLAALTITGVGNLSGTTLNYHCRGLHAGPVLMRADELMVWSLIKNGELDPIWLTPQRDQQPIWPLVQSKAITMDDALLMSPPLDSAATMILRQLN